MNEPMVPLSRPLIGDEEREAADTVLLSGMLAQGTEVAAFEREFADLLLDGRRCLAVSSGTSGLHLGLLAAGVGPGDEVIVPSFTFAATANSVALTGARPVFADIESAHFCLDPEATEAVVTDRTVGIMPVHLYGHPADMGRLRSVADRHGLAIYEDAAQAHGARWDGRPVGTFGDFAMFSFYATKNMTTGEGGMVACETDELVHRISLLRNQGMIGRYQNEVVGYNARMTDLQAAIGRVQLRRLSGWTAQRQLTAHYFDAHLEGVIVPAVAHKAEHVYHQYTIRVSEDREGFAAALAREHGVASGVYYPTPVHRLASFGLDLDLPETERACAEALSLPVHPDLRDDHLDRIVGAVNAVAKAGA